MCNFVESGEGVPQLTNHRAGPSVALVRRSKPPHLFTSPSSSPRNLEWKTQHPSGSSESAFRFYCGLMARLTLPRSPALLNGGRQVSKFSAQVIG